MTNAEVRSLHRCYSVLALSKLMEPLNMMERALSALCSSALLISVAGCEQKPKLVYVPEGPQTVTLVSSASATSVQQGGTVVLSVQRQLSGNWKQVPLSEV